MGRYFLGQVRLCYFSIIFALFYLRSPVVFVLYNLDENTVEKPESLTDLIRNFVGNRVLTDLRSGSRLDRNELEDLVEYNFDQHIIRVIKQMCQS